MHNSKFSLKILHPQCQFKRELSKEDLQKFIKDELDEYDVKTPFEFDIYSNGLATKIKSDKFHFDKDNTYSIPIFIDNEGKTNTNYW